jgi:hypothetical protein
MLFQRRLDCFCAFCKTPRRVYKTKFLGILSIFALAGFSVLLTYVIWDSLDLRGVILFTLFLFVGELFSQVKWRQSMICVNCGFDLILYKKSPERAGEKIKDFMFMRSDRPEFLLKPALQITPTRKTTSVDSKGNNKAQENKISLPG